MKKLTDGEVNYEIANRLEPYENLHPCSTVPDISPLGMWRNSVLGGGKWSPRRFNEDPAAMVALLEAMYEAGCGTNIDTFRDNKESLGGKYDVEFFDLRSNEQRSECANDNLPLAVRDAAAEALGVIE
jgi:hypothetical protein